MQKQHRIFLYALLACGVFTRVFRLGDKILWADEGYDLAYAKLSSFSELLAHSRYSVHVPLPHFIDLLWVHAFGDSVFVLHLQSVIWSVLTLLLFAYTAMRFFPWRVGLGATALFSLSAFLPEFAQTFRYFALLGFCTQVWLHALLMYRDTGRAHWAVVYGIAQAAALAAHYYALFPLMCVMAYVVLWRRSSGVRPLPVFTASAAATLVMIPMFVLMQRTGIIGLAQPVPLHDALEHLAQVPVGGIAHIVFALLAGRYVPLESVPAPFAVLILAATAAVAAAALFHESLRRDAALCALVVAGSLFLGWLGMIFRGIFFHSKYFIMAAPFLALILSMGADRLRRTHAVFPFLLFVFFTAVSIPPLFLYWSRINRPENIRSLFEYVDAHKRPGDFLNVSPPYSFAFDYYFNGGMPLHDFSDDFSPRTTPHSNYFYVFSKDYQLKEEDMVQWHAGLASRYGRVWMFWMYGARNTEDGNGIARRWLDTHYERIQTIPYRIMPYIDKHEGEMVLYRIRK